MNKENKIENLKCDTFINTINGKAFYIKTENEDKNGKWNDNYYTSNGYYLIHEGNKHHVYKIQENIY